MCLDNFFTGSRDNIAHHIGNPRFEVIRHDVVEPILLECDQVYHLACPASPVHYKFNPVKTIKTNVIGTLNMLGLAKRVKARFLLTSTSEVYGDPLQHPQTEEYWGNVNPIGERVVLRRGQAVRGDVGFRLLPRARARDSRRAHLQHVRPADGVRRRTRGVQLCEASDREHADDNLRRRLADAVVSVRERSGPPGWSRSWTASTRARSTSGTPGSSR